MNDERLFDAHMFAKHSFGVKYPPGISSNVTPPHQNRIMTASLISHPSPPVPAAVVASHSATSPRLAPEIYRARRVAVLAVAFAVAVGALVGVASIGNQAAASRGVGLDSSNSVSITVMPGDTLWGIAESLRPGSDPRPLVHELSKLAGSGSIQPGQVIVIPESLVD